MLASKICFRQCCCKAEFEVIELWRTYGPILRSPVTVGDVPLENGGRSFARQDDPLCLVKLRSSIGDTANRAGTAIDTNLDRTVFMAGI